LSWSDAHKDYDNTLIEVYSKVNKVLNNGGNIWIAEAGQSDFSSDLVRKIQEKMSRVHTTERIVVVQHSEWNEEMSRKENLSFLKKNSKYHKIPDGNVLHNGTPGYSTSDHVDWMSALEDEENLAIWKLATSLADTYNGYQGRYLNKAVKAGGLDFSDFCEVHQILNLDKIDSCMDYFEFIKINTDN